MELARKRRPYARPTRRINWMAFRGRPVLNEGIVAVAGLRFPVHGAGCP